MRTDRDILTSSASYGYVPVMILDSPVCWRMYLCDLPVILKSM
jgi:hypothetical protein